MVESDDVVVSETCRHLSAMLGRVWWHMCACLSIRNCAKGFGNLFVTAGGSSPECVWLGTHWKNKNADIRRSVAEVRVGMLDWGVVALLADARLCPDTPLHHFAGARWVVIGRLVGSVV